MSDDQIFVVMESSYTVEGGNKPVVMLFSRDYNDPTKSYTHKFYNFQPYFWVSAFEVYNRSSHMIKRIEADDVYLDALGRPICKVVTYLPSDVPKVRDLFSWTDMADFVFDKRFLVDKHIKYAYKIVGGEPIPVDVEGPMLPRIVFCDIECVSPIGIFPDPGHAAFPIITIQVMDSLTKKIIVFTSDVVKQTDDPVHVVCGDEKELIKAFTAYLRHIDPDIIGGWNFEQFDIPYIINRSKNIGVSLKGLSRSGIARTEYSEKMGSFANRIPGRAIPDMMAAFKKYNIGMGQRESFGLKSVIGDHELLDKYDKDGNLEIAYAFEYPDLGPMLQQIIDEQRFDELIDYCKNDVIALDNINESLGLYMYFESIRFVGGSKIMDCMFNSKVIEMLLLHEGIRAMPTRNHTTTTEKFPGALVVTPVAGIHEDTLTVDVSSMYPMVMIGFNVSPDVDGIVVKAMKKIMELREHYREQKKLGIKGADALDSGTKAVANSFYGVTGSPAFRLYNKSNALFVTSTGQDINRYIQKCAGELNLNTIYGDSVGNTTKVKIYNAAGAWRYVTVEELFTQVDFIKGDKEYCNLADTYVESIDEDGNLILDEVPYIMRHACNKQMYNIRLTTDWSIDVTEDHSLFVYANKAVMPRALQKYRAITCSTKEFCEGKLKSVITRRSSKHTSIDSLNNPIKWYEYLGYHVGNGSLQYNVCHNNNAYYGGVSFGDDVDELYPYFVPFMQEQGHFTNTYGNNRGDKYRGDFRYSGLEYIKFIEKNVGHSHEKHVPEFMFYETIENIQAFIRGYFTADGTVMMRSGLPIVRLTSINRDLIDGVQRLLYVCGIPSSSFTESNVNTYNGKSSGTYSIHLVVADIKKFRDEVGFITARKQDRLQKCNDFKVETGIDWSFSNSAVKTKIEYTGFVYDLHCKQTNRYFANNILVHNTDSCFVSPVVNVEQALRLETFLNTKLVEWCREKGCIVNISLKAEKLFKRLLFKSSSSNRNKSSKKKYAGYLIWKEGKVVNELSFMGLELKRSDQSNVTKECLLYFLETLLIQGNQDLAVSKIRDNYKSIKNGKVNILDISIPKAIRKIKYAASNPWVQGIQYAKDEHNYIIQEGAKPRLIYLKYEQTICIDEGFDVSKIIHDIDWEKMANVTIRKKLESYLWSLGFDWNTVVDGQLSLEKWF